MNAGVGGGVVVIDARWVGGGCSGGHGKDEVTAKCHCH